MNEAKATLFIICWVVLVTGVYITENVESLNESTRPRSMAGNEEKSLNSWLVGYTDKQSRRSNGVNHSYTIQEKE